VQFIDRRIHLMTGKGGVGKTTVAVALARALAEAGERTLICEIGDPGAPWSPLGRTLGKDELTAQPHAFGPRLSACLLDASLGHELFLRSILPAGPLIRAALRSKSLSRFLTAAPSFFEMGIFYHLLTLLDGRDAFDKIVVDMPATGHALALTGLPEILLRLIPGGPIAKALERGKTWLNTPSNAAAWIVTLPEQLPVTEAIELAKGLGATDMTVGGVLLNRMPRWPVPAEQRAELEAWLGDRAVHGQRALERMKSGDTAFQRLQAAGLDVLRLPEIEDPAMALATHLGAA
jgi:Mrp family chromosome partitioning ATPase